MDPRIADYIRVNRSRYIREAITEQLVRAGHDREAIDSAWEELATDEPAAGVTGRNLAAYVWIIYWLGAGIIGAITLISSVGTGSGFGFFGFGIGWLVAYLFLAVWPARALARARPSGAGGVLAIIVGVPLIVVLIGGGICFGTIAIIAAGLSG